MPTQEDRVLARVRQLYAYIRDRKVVKSEELYAWALTSLGIRDRTVAQYLHALTLMDSISHDLKTGLVQCTGRNAPSFTSPASGRTVESGNTE